MFFFARQKPKIRFRSFIKLWDVNLQHNYCLTAFFINGLLFLDDFEKIVKYCLMNIL
jgi:hypothetical protein